MRDRHKQKEAASAKANPKLQESHRQSAPFAEEKPTTDAAAATLDNQYSGQPSSGPIQTTKFDASPQTSHELQALRRTPKELRLRRKIVKEEAYRRKTESLLAATSQIGKTFAFISSFYFLPILTGMFSCLGMLDQLGAKWAFPIVPFTSYVYDIAPTLAFPTCGLLAGWLATNFGSASFKLRMGIRRLMAGLGLLFSVLIFVALNKENSILNYENTRSATSFCLELSLFAYGLSTMAWILSLKKEEPNLSRAHFRMLAPFWFIFLACLSSIAQGLAWGAWIPNHPDSATQITLKSDSAHPKTKWSVVITTNSHYILAHKKSPSKPNELPEINVVKIEEADPRSH